MIEDWDDAYANAAYIAGGADYPQRWAAAAVAFRAGAGGATDIAYGPHPRHRLDLFAPAGAAHGLVVFLHGGYWMAFGKDDWSHLAAGALARGWAVAMPSYRLCPEARVRDIAADCAAAIAAAATRMQGPIVLCGHSAGGQLVARLVCADSPLDPAIAARLRRVVPISGLSDLRPLMRTRMNATLRLDDGECRTESPALNAPRAGVEVVAWVGADERPEFRRQSALIANIWTGLGARTHLHAAAGRHHFDVIEDLADPASALVGALCA